MHLLLILIEEVDLLFLGRSSVVLLLDVIHQMECVGWVCLVGNDEGGDEHTDDEGCTDCVGFDLAFDVETEKGHCSCDEDMRANTVKTHDGLGGFGCEAFMVEILAIFGRVAVRKAGQRSESQSIGSDQIKKSQEAINTALLFSAFVESAEIEEQIGDEEENVDEASSDDGSEVLEDKKTKGFSDRAKPSSLFEVVQNSMVGEAEVD